MLEVPEFFIEASVYGIVFCLLFGGIFSIPSVWHRVFPTLLKSDLVESQITDDHKTDVKKATPLYEIYLKSGKFTGGGHIGRAC